MKRPYLALAFILLVLVGGLAIVGGARAVGLADEYDDTPQGTASLRSRAARSPGRCE